MRVGMYELFSLMGGIVVLAGISVAIINGGQTAAVIRAFGNAFTTAIKAATLQK